MARTEYNDEQDHDADIAEMIEGVRQIGSAIASVAREAGAWPSAAQWARARALADAEAWIQHVTTPSLDERDGPTSVEAQVAIELLARRWAAWIESGEFPA